MVSANIINDQLKNIRFNARTWNRAEATELAAIILPEEQIFECVGGWYEGGIALLVATNIRVLLIDKKPFKFLNVEDVRFDTINQIDYGHRFLDAHIGITTGLKNLTFRSYNQVRLRKLIGHVQRRMAEIKIDQDNQSNSQREHLKQIDQQLQSYLLSQYQQQESIKQFVVDTNSFIKEKDHPIEQYPVASNQGEINMLQENMGVSSDELYEEGRKEVFGKQIPKVLDQSTDITSQPVVDLGVTTNVSKNPLEINPLKIAYSKLPLVLRDRKYVRTILGNSATKIDYNPLSNN